LPNFKIIQDMPDQARIKIYGTNDVAINTDTLGNLAITTLGNALAITTLGNAMSITTSGNALAITTLGNAMSITTSGNALAITTLGNALAITTLGNAMSITTSGNALAITTLGDALAITTLGNAMSITTSGNALAITTLGNALAITTLGNAMSITTSGNALAITTLGNPMSITVASPIPVTGSLAISDVTYPTGTFSGAGAALITPNQDVLGMSKWSWIAYNTSTETDASAIVKMQGSPDNVRWLDNSSVVTLGQYGITCMVPSYFLKYSRVYYSAAGSTNTSLNVYFQGQS
jgi:hypothetical protein